MKIYTRTGDKGETSLYSGERVRKSDRRINCIGEIDELCSNLGLLKAQSEDDANRKFLHSIQQDLFNIMSMLASKNDVKYHLPRSRYEALEAEINRLQGLAPEYDGFVTPGENIASAHADITRTIARRIERNIFAFAEHEAVDAASLIYLNRLSDYLFIYARTLAAAE